MKVFQLTYIEYPSEDKYFGFLMALFSLAPILLLPSILTTFVYSRDLRVGFLSLGLILSTVINEVLKAIIKQQRPLLSHRKGYGMPSDHAQFMFFLFVVARNMLKDKRFRPGFARVVSSVLFIASVLVMISRIYLGVHTLSQVFIGALIGFIFGAIWTKLFEALSSEGFISHWSNIIDSIWFTYCEFKIIP